MAPEFITYELAKISSETFNPMGIGDLLKNANE